jgi:hypothetical protein
VVRQQVELDDRGAAVALVVAADLQPAHVVPFKGRSHDYPK